MNSQLCANPLALFIRYCLLPAAGPLDDSRIVGGYECAPHSKPWQVHLNYKGSFFCGGSLIAPRWIVSAAHCYLLPKYVVAHIGMHDVSKAEGTVQIIQVEKSFQHYKYNSSSIDNDIMLIKLAEPAQFNHYVQPIPLAHSCPIKGTTCVVSGYGNMRPGFFGEFPDRLQCLDLPVLPEDSCKSSYGDDITNNMFCAGFQEGGKDSCQASIQTNPYSSFDRILVQVWDLLSRMLGTWGLPGKGCFRSLHLLALSSLKNHLNIK
uniref:Peptidase S1 domain-containing protein n=1 Tax=Xenopus tropicalis TaxID=8364 RepID=A0A803JTW3_XENTR